MKQLLYLLAFGLLVPSAALARVDPNVAAQCQDARDFHGCVRAFTTPVRRSDDTPHGVMGAGGCRPDLRPGLPQRTPKFPPGHYPGWSC